jgi:tetratricopeptide (TPR) repeat protein
MKRWFVFGVLAVALVFVADLVQAQVGSCRGKVKDESGEALVDAEVVMEFQGGLSQKYETKTNKKGEFIQVGMRTGPYRITVTKQGYRGTYIDTQIRIGDASNLGTFTLTSQEAAMQAAAEESVAKIKDGFDAAIKLTEAGKWDEAEAAFKGLVEQSPSVPELHYNLGFIASKKKDWAAAEAAFQKAIELRPDYGEAHVALSGVYTDSGQKEKAVAALAKAAEGDLADPKVQFNLGVQFFNNNEFPQAQTAFERALQADPEMTEAYYHLGNVLVNQGQLPEAVEKLEKYLSMNPENAQNAAMAKQMVDGLKQYVTPKQ